LPSNRIAKKMSDRKEVRREWVNARKLVRKAFPKAPDYAAGADRAP
jgi:hypothetical protein